MKTIRKVALSSLLALMLLAVPLLAANAGELDPEGHTRMALRVAEATGLSVEEVATLFEEGNGYGNIARAASYAAATGTSVQEALTLGAEVGWGNLFKDAGLDNGHNGLGWFLRTVVGLGDKHSFEGEDNSGPGNSGNGNANGHSNGNHGNSGDHDSDDDLDDDLDDDVDDDLDDAEKDKDEKDNSGHGNGNGNGHGRGHGNGHSKD